MHLRHLWMVVGLFAAFAAEGTIVYKWRDADGVVHFSDTAVPGAEKIVTSSVTANGIGGPTLGSAVAAPNKAPSSTQSHTEMSIESPAPDQVFFNDEVVTVRLHVEPSLKPGQQVTWQLNGQQLTGPGTDGASFSLQGLDRGTYTLAANITDSGTGVTQSSPGVTFYVRQPSELSSQHKKS